MPIPVAEGNWLLDTSILIDVLRLSHGVGFLDSLVAATSHDLPIATLNLKHFEPLPDVRARRPY